MIFLFPRWVVCQFPGGLTATWPLKMCQTYPLKGRKADSSPQPPWLSGVNSLLRKGTTRLWFQIFFMFTPTWGNDPIWLIFFKWVETTNQTIFDRGKQVQRSRERIWGGSSIALTIDVCHQCNLWTDCGWWHFDDGWRWGLGETARSIPELVSG